MATKGNGYDPTLLKDLLSEIDDCDDRLLQERSKYMLACKPLRQDIAAVKERAKEAGIPKRAFSTLIANHRLERDIARNESKLEADDAAEYEQLVTSLGDYVNLPLGAAAAARARPGHQESTLDSLNS